MYVPATDEPPSPSRHVSSPTPLRHVAIIMDGNGRWAEKRGLPRIAGHRAGVDAVRRTVRAARDLGVAVVTLFGFSVENWGRSALEVEGIFRLVDEFLSAEARALADEGIRLRIIGDKARLPPRTRALIDEAERLTRFGRSMTLCVALSYGGRAEIAKACRAIAEKVEAGELDSAAIDDAVVQRHLMTRDLPDPDLLIRTASEKRLSNFLLWQLAYAEMVFLDCAWPDFGKRQLEEALGEYGRRNRRFGLI